MKEWVAIPFHGGTAVGREVLQLVHPEVRSHQVDRRPNGDGGEGRQAEGTRHVPGWLLPGQENPPGDIGARPQGRAERTGVSQGFHAGSQKIGFRRELIGDERRRGGQHHAGESLSGAEAIPPAERIEIGTLVRYEEDLAVVGGRQKELTHLRAAAFSQMFEGVVQRVEFAATLDQHLDFADQRQLRGLGARPGASHVEWYGSHRDTPRVARSRRPSRDPGTRGAQDERPVRG